MERAMAIRIVPERISFKQYPWEEPSWVDSVVDHLGQIDVALNALGIDRAAVTRDLFGRLGSLAAEFPEDFAPLRDHSALRPQARARWVQIIKEFITGLKVIEEKDMILTRELPLCVFDAPNVPNAKTTYSESESTDATAGWSIEVLGTGFGSDVTLSVTQSSEFTASSGERKLIFAPLHIRVVRAALYKRGKLHERFLKAELFEPEVRDAHGIRSLNTADWRTMVGPGTVLERFDLSGDTGHNTAKYVRKYELSGTFETSLGFTAFDLESKVTAKCSAKQTAEVTFELPPRHLYELRAPLAVAGFYFGP
jgi:hypothetical protein